MNNTSLQILKQICGEMKHKKSYGKCFHEIAEKLDTILTLPYREMLLLGFLHSKEVLIAYFGDSCWMCCRDIKGHLLHATEEENVKYHGDNLTGLSWEECLEYYRRNKPNI